MNKENRVILIDTKNKTAFDLTFIDDAFSSYGDGTLIDNINEMNFELAVSLLQITTHGNNDATEPFFESTAYSIMHLSKFREAKPDVELYNEFCQIT